MGAGSGETDFMIAVTGGAWETGALLAKKAGAGLTEKWPRIKSLHPESDLSVYRQRLTRELDIIDHQGLAACFLALADLVDYARQSNIRIGPGRGPVPGSLACFCLGITTVDPLAHGLLFERFLTRHFPSRPAVVLDVCVSGYRQIIDWLLETYAPARNRNAAVLAVSDATLRCCPPHYQPKDETRSRFDVKAAESFGLMQFSLLELRELSVISDTLALIEKQGPAVPDMDRLDDFDAATCRLFANGDTSGVFQFEGDGMKALLKRSRPQSVSELAVLIALDRPGPFLSGIADDYIERKQGKRKVIWPLMELEPVLSGTCGLLIYQEQIMQAVKVLAGFSPEQADDLRRAIGKRDRKTVEGYRQLFVDRLTAGGMDGGAARHFFEDITRFGEYGFCKAHATACALIAWQCAYLKAHFRELFVTARQKRRARVKRS